MWTGESCPISAGSRKGEDYIQEDAEEIDCRKGDNAVNTEYMRQMFSLDKKCAVVTGGSSGIGRGIALSLANFGAHVLILGRSREGLEKTAEMVRESGGQCESYVVDITKEQEVDAFFKELQNQGRTVDIFIANAGINIRGELLDTTSEEIDSLITTNYKGTLYGLIRAGKMMEAQKSGNIVVISSINGISAMPNLAVYSSVKYALEGITRSLAASLGPSGVRVNSCAPGVILTRINENVYDKKENRDAKLENIPLRRLGEPREIGDVVACMVSDAFSFMTGTTILVDGGELLRGMQKQKM